MDHNHKLLHANVNPYFTPTSFDSDITNPVLHNLTNQVYQIHFI